jgi:hypothetical protein
LHTRAQYADPARARASPEELLTGYRDGRTTFAGGHFAGSVFDATAGIARSY